MSVGDPGPRLRTEPPDAGELAEDELAVGERDQDPHGYVGNDHRSRRKDEERVEQPASVTVVQARPDSIHGLISLIDDQQARAGASPDGARRTSRRSSTHNAATEIVSAVIVAAVEPFHV